MSEWHKAYAINHKVRVAHDLYIIREKVPPSAEFAYRVTMGPLKRHRFSSHSRFVRRTAFHGLPATAGRGSQGNDFPSRRSAARSQRSIRESRNRPRFSAGSSRWLCPAYLSAAIPWFSNATAKQQLVLQHQPVDAFMVGPATALLGPLVTSAQQYGGSDRLLVR